MPTKYVPNTRRVEELMQQYGWTPPTKTVTGELDLHGWGLWKAGCMGNAAEPPRPKKVTAKAWDWKAIKDMWPQLNENQRTLALILYGQAGAVLPGDTTYEDNDILARARAITPAEKQRRDAEFRTALTVRGQNFNPRKDTGLAFLRPLYGAAIGPNANRAPTPYGQWKGTSSSWMDLLKVAGTMYGATQLASALIGGGGAAGAGAAGAGAGGGTTSALGLNPAMSLGPTGYQGLSGLTLGAAAPTLGAAAGAGAGAGAAGLGAALGGATTAGSVLSTLGKTATTIPKWLDTLALASGALTAGKQAQTQAAAVKAEQQALAQQVATAKAEEQRKAQEWAATEPYRAQLEGLVKASTPFYNTTTGAAQNWLSGNWGALPKGLTSPQEIYQSYVTPWDVEAQKYYGEMGKGINDYLLRSGLQGSSMDISKQIGAQNWLALQRALGRAQGTQAKAAYSQQGLDWLSMLNRNRAADLARWGFGR